MKMQIMKVAVMALSSQVVPFKAITKKQLPTSYKQTEAVHGLT